MEIIDEGGMGKWYRDGEALESGGEGLAGLSNKGDIGVSDMLGVDETNTTTNHKQIHAKGECYHEKKN